MRVEEAAARRDAQVLAALRTFALVWAIEVTLARVTGQPQRWLDVLLSAGFLIGVPGLIVARVRSARARALVTLLPLAVVSAGIVLPAVYATAGLVAAALAIVALAALCLQPLLRSADSGSATPAVGVVLGVLVGGTAVAWVCLPSGFPPFQIHFPFLFMAVLLARLATREYGLPMVLLGGVAMTVWPPVLPPFPWFAEQEAAGRPDLMVVSVDIGESAQGLPTLDRSDGHHPPLRLAAPSGAVALRPFIEGSAPGSHIGENLAALGYDTAAVVGPEPGLEAAASLYRGFAVFHHFIDRHRFALPRARVLLGDQRQAASDFAARPVVADLIMSLGVIDAPQFAGAAEVFGVVAKVMAERRERPIFVWAHFRDDPAAVDTQIDRIARSLAATTARPYLMATIVFRGDSASVSWSGTHVEAVALGTKTETTLAEVADQIRRASMRAK